MKILIKENDRLKSTVHKNRVVSEYLIYLMSGDVAIKCYNEIGEIAKRERVNEMLLTDFEISDYKNNINEVVTEIPYKIKKTI